MSWDPTTFKARFEEFASVTDAKVTDALDEALLEVDADKWSNWFDRGVGYLAAHILKIRTTIESGDTNLDTLSPLVTKAVGDVSVSLGAYLANNPDAEILNLSPYGKEYFRLRKMRTMGGLAIG